MGAAGLHFFFGMQGSPTQRDGQRKAICRKRPPPPAEMCCIPVTGLSLGYGGAGAPFGDDMVLQHGRPAAIFGLAKAGADTPQTKPARHRDTLGWLCPRVEFRGWCMTACGVALAGAAVTVSYNGNSYHTTANPDPWDVPAAPLSANAWRVELPPQPPGPAAGTISAPFARARPAAIHPACTPHYLPAVR